MSTATIEQPLAALAHTLAVAAPDQPLPGAAPLRLLPAPISDPPYDDERGGALPLRAAGVARPRLRLISAPEPVEDTAPADATPAAPFARSLVQRLLEVVAGVRPLSHLQRDTTLKVYEQLEVALQSQPRLSGARPDGRAVRSVHSQLQAGGQVAEISATVRRGGRFGAIALRLERSGASWTCTELVGPA